MNGDNLRALSTSEAREIGRRGGIASGAARRERKQLKDAAQAILNMPVKKGELGAFDCLAEAGNANVTVADKIILEQVSNALKGDTKAARFLAEITGGMQAQKVDVSLAHDIDKASDEIQRMIEEKKARERNE